MLGQELDSLADSVGRCGDVADLLRSLGHRLPALLHGSDTQHR